ncbi:MAG: mechanosensitive ion channel [Rhodospirillaceae bacterium]|jgi:small conductance mechanosensitive channel|nr:mechanosensitive ion channel [Rhodospirillaceae bacterium]MBT3883942.1 mechanosensitive ion channel [Rhodospirillaceae bacterium]MBT4117712.1 mechanosensitive ion channel [Rhodospirillaceae bacterium]MBT4674469.1 mechanosensitive ion channel [Rhodospirillaceae bacterium]MBT4751149.1 mechanosensitive ion channel [Rhodospirillaceae bacterium]
MNNTLDKTHSTLEQVVQQLIGLVSTYGIDVLGAIIVLLVGLWLSGWMQRAVRKVMERSSRVDATLVGFFSSVARYVVLIVTGMAVLDRFGVETTSLVAVLGAAGLAIGLALQGTLSNVAAGVMLLIFRPFKVGDFVEAAGQAATVQELNLFFTVMATLDNVRITIPNGQIWGATLKNFSANPIRRVDFVFGISYDADIDKAMDTIRDLVSSDARVHKDPEPFLAVSNLGDSSVDITVRVWAQTEDYWAVNFDTIKAVKQRFDAEGIGIPFPSRTIYSVRADD